MTSVAALLREAELPRLEADVLLADLLKVNRAWLVAHDHDELSDPQCDIARARFARRRAGVPVAYILGEREFYGLSFSVTPAVLIPRPETELLVEIVVDWLMRAQRRELVVVDLGTGCGAIAIALEQVLKAQAITAKFVAIDVSPAALEVARANATTHGAQIQFVHGDWLAGQSDSAFDVIVANPPYIAAEDTHLSTGDLRFEPRSALASGEDGLDAIRSIIADAPRVLRPGGLITLEHGAEQGAAVRRLLVQDGFTEPETHRDLAGLERVTTAYH